MKINILDTHMRYTEMLSLPENERSAFFTDQFLKPFDPLFQLTGMPRNAEMMACLALTGMDGAAKMMLEQLTSANVWGKARQALERAMSCLSAAGIPVPEDVTLGIFLGDPAKLAPTQGYTGVGSIPGYIQIIVAPNDENLPKLPACIAHEFHHNALFLNTKWNFMNVTLKQYLAVEGLAESFASALYGDDSVGPWVTGITAADLEKTRKIIGSHLDVDGFMEVRKYIFGDHPMVPESEATGVPYCGGYAVGYHAVQAYLRKADKTVAEATKAFISEEDVISQSGYFG